MSAPERLATWPQIEASAPVMAATMRRYLEQIACSLRPGSVSNADQALRAFAGFLHQSAPDVVTRRRGRPRPHRGLQALARRPGRAATARGSASTPARTGWAPCGCSSSGSRSGAGTDRPERVPILFGDLPRQDKPLPKALDDPAAAKFLRAAQNQPRLLRPRRLRSPASGPACGSAS